MIFIRDLSYSDPGAVIWLLALPPLLVLYLWYGHWRRQMARRFASERLLRRIAPISGLLALRAAAKLAAAALAIVALMGPRGNPQYPEGKGTWNGSATLKRKAHTIYFIIDNSLSMTTPDSTAGKNRLDHAREIASEVAARLSGESVALTAFTSEATTLVPATLDTLFFRMQLHYLGPNSGDVSGSDLRAGFNAIDLGSGESSIIFISDGGDNAFEEMSQSDKEQYIAAIAKQLPNATLYIIGTGTVEGDKIPDLIEAGAPVHSSLDEEALQQLAREAGGRYFAAETMSTLALVDTIIAGINAHDPYISDVELLLRSDDTLIYDHYYQVPLAGALLLLGWALFFPDSYSRRER